MTTLRSFYKSAKGSVMMESVLMLPIMLLALMAAVQIAHIFFARHITEYAAYSAARSGRLALTPAVALENALKAAKQSCSIIALTAPAGHSGALYALPWLGEVAGSQNLDNKISVSFPAASVPQGAFAAEVTMHFPLVVPVVNQFLSGILKFRDEVLPPSNSPDSPGILEEGTPYSYHRSYDGDIFPHITITRRALVPANPPLAAEGD